MQPVSIKVWGDYACFTRPEMKVERVSYEAMTPSAARGVLEAIFWKPQFDWVVERIDVLRPIRFTSILRNELSSRANPSTAKKWAREGGQGAHYVIEKDRTQRHALILRDVAYHIHAQVRVRSGCDAPAAKFRDQFRRRVRKGQCFWTPYLGCREFSAFFGEIGEDAQRPLPIDYPIGRMLFDLKYSTKRDKTFGQGSPLFFDAEVKQGVLHVPTHLYEQTLAEQRSR